MDLNLWHCRIVEYFIQLTKTFHINEISNLLDKNKLNWRHHCFPNDTIPSRTTFILTIILYKRSHPNSYFFWDKILNNSKLFVLESPSLTPPFGNKQLHRVLGKQWFKKLPFVHARFGKEIAVSLYRQALKLLRKKKKILKQLKTCVVDSIDFF